MCIVRVLARDCVCGGGRGRGHLPAVPYAPPPGRAGCAITGAPLNLGAFRAPVGEAQAPSSSPTLTGACPPAPFSLRPPRNSPRRAPRPCPTTRRRTACSSPATWTAAATSCTRSPRRRREGTRRRCVHHHRACAACCMAWCSAGVRVGVRACVRGEGGRSGGCGGVEGGGGQGQQRLRQQQGARLPSATRCEAL